MSGLLTLCRGPAEISELADPHAGFTGDLLDEKRNTSAASATDHGSVDLRNSVVGAPFAKRQAWNNSGNRSVGTLVNNHGRTFARSCKLMI